MSKEIQELEEVKNRIRLKQAKLFERRLDDFLEVELLAEQNPEKRKELYQTLLQLKILDLSEENQENFNPEEEDNNER